jgi:dienelactone hydrolase
MQPRSKLIGALFLLVAVLALVRKNSTDRHAPAAPRMLTGAPTAASTVAKTEVEPTLGAARREFSTRISERANVPLPLPNPPAALFVRTDVTGMHGLVLPAYVTPDPQDGRKHPAIIWLTGGETNSLDDFWTPGPEANDQSASAFRQAGVVMMFPTLRGGNTNQGGKEYFFGEIDDVLAAAEHLARQSYVDPEQIYLGGHSTGGTLALLTAETSGRFKAVFAFGPVSTVDSYPASLVPVDLGQRDGAERRLRSPIYWLHGITSPTYLIEGRSPPSNAANVAELCAKSRNPQVHCILPAGLDHFSVLSPVSRVIAARLSIARDIPFALQPGEFDSQSARH